MRLEDLHSIGLVPVGGRQRELCLQLSGLLGGHRLHRSHRGAGDGNPFVLAKGERRPALRDEAGAPLERYEETAVGFGIVLRNDHRHAELGHDIAGADHDAIPGPHQLRRDGHPDLPLGEVVDRASGPGGEDLSADFKPSKLADSYRALPPEEHARQGVLAGFNDITEKKIIPEPEGDRGRRRGSGQIHLAL